MGPHFCGGSGVGEALTKCGGKKGLLMQFSLAYGVAPALGNSRDNNRCRLVKESSGPERSMVHNCYVLLLRSCLALL